MKTYLRGFFYSLPVQLLLLHLRRYQLLLLFWYLLFSTINGNFLKLFGARSLYLAPEYLDQVSPLSTAMVGAAIAIFIMAWNITTFILHGQHLRFLATTAQPFLKYCINNAVLPVVFLMVYCYRTVQYGTEAESFGTFDLVLLLAGFFSGFFVIIAIAFTYFFGADITIYRSLKKNMIEQHRHYESMSIAGKPAETGRQIIKVEWFLSATLGLRKPRNVNHYSQDFLDTIFKRHHIAAVMSIVLAFSSMLLVGYFMDNRFFQFPAAASITIFFAICLSFIGAISYFLQSWSIPVVLGVVVVLNSLYNHEIIDPRNKAFGLNYENKSDRPIYDKASISQICAAANMQADSLHFVEILNNWKSHQDSAKPKLVIINTSGGGLRSATFTMNILQRLDSLLKGKLMQRTFAITGASGGMLGATYYRELYREFNKGKNVNLLNRNYVDDIGKDLLNPLFTSYVTRDMFGPVRRFKFSELEYRKDRGYAFEEKLNKNTNGILNKQLKDYVQDEQAAKIPLMIFNSVITRDSRKMMICSQPISFMMRNGFDSSKMIGADADAIEFTRLFAKQAPYNIRLLTALRMNATFPYVLPNVWLPTNPVIDVMDAGMRDNFGQETALRLISRMQSWIDQNTSGVLLIECRDRTMNDWENDESEKAITDILTKPATLLQTNWYKMQDYFQEAQMSYSANALNVGITRIAFQYISSNKKHAAALNFHLTKVEKEDIAQNLYNEHNSTAFSQIAKMLMQ
jgi:hypothetical protein